MLDRTTKYLSQKGWDFQKVDEDTITTGFTTTLDNGDEQTFPLSIMMIKDAYEINYLRLVSVPFIEQPLDGFTVDLFRAVGQINHDLVQTKFAFDADMDLELIMDIPESQLEEKMFDTALSVLADCAGSYYSELKMQIQ